MKRFAMLAKLIVSCFFVLMATSVASGQNDFILLPRFRKKTRQFRNRVLVLERYLGMSVTTKSHLAEDHSCEQQEDLDGIGNLGKDFGERNHQDEAKADRRLGCVRNFAKREAIMSKEEVQTKDQKVQAKMVEIKRQRKRGQPEGTAALQTARKQRRLDARDDVLTSPAPEGTMIRSRDRRVLKLREA
jgi:hypothetical protein